MVFVVPLFLWVPLNARVTRQSGAIRRAMSELATTLHALPARRSLFSYLGASLLYRDALNGIYAFGGIYAAGVLGWSVVQIGVFGIIAAAVGALGCWVGGKLDSRIGPKPVIMGCVLILLAVCVVIVGTDRSTAVFLPVAAGSVAPDIVFYACGAFIGIGGGSLQSASRTMLVRQADPARMTEGFGLYALSGKVLAFIAPALVALVTTLTESQRMGVVPLIFLFAAGLALLAFVNPDGEPEFR
jgi:UMF1 family MFS transporter